ncbi:hypothetical protein BCR39DRAFT_509279 [Naematelia encephala]|uniref:SUR7/PalI family-domain-containing protein n=1 Tax=Naematelia encephala TaxID=71784 RepID=A0A1Y2BKU8_9TREE|nr:hypothetical protein BCR39DRAFT_509279 [Naematelia encephala]
MPIKIAEENGNQQVVRRYKHTMRKSPYLVSLLLLLAATTLTLLNIYIADLIHVIVKSPGPLEFETKYGLYRRCTRKSPIPNSLFLMPSHPLPSSDVLYTMPELGTIDNEGDGWQCQEFPTRSECAEFGEKFCVLWSTAGYSAQLSLVPCLVSLVSLLFIFLHRGQKTARARARRQQWKLVSVTMLIHCLLQILSIALILHVFRTDGRFEARGSHLDKSFDFGVASAIISGAVALMLTFTGMAARAGKPWAAGTSAKKARRHRRTRSGQVVPVPEGTAIPPEQIVTVGEVRAAAVVESPDERTSLLAGQERVVAGGGDVRATDENV